jgi:Carboxypeptidase regulatory-like domain
VKLAASLLLILCGAASLRAQTATLRGTVTDESGAVVPGVTVALSGSGGLIKTAITAGDGVYTLAGLVPGEYTVQASAPQLVLPQPRALTIRGGVQTLNLRLAVASVTQQIVVEENAGPTVSTDAASNATATVLRGDDLDSLSDDPEDLQSDLEALAGPAAGPGGGSIFIDGFSSGELPAKESIREIRINQNPFSPEFDKLGLGRIEIFTKPGTDKFHASIGYNFANQFWNARNPYSGPKAPLSLNEWENSFSGPLSKRASFALEATRNNVDNGSIINGVTLDSNNKAVQLLDTFRTIQRRTLIGPRLDYQLNENNTITLRYRFIRGDIQGAGIGGFNETTHGYNTNFLIQSAQFVETSVHGATVNETRFQFYRNAAENLANSSEPGIQVLGAFTGGGSPLGRSRDTLTNFELQNNTTAVHGAHTWRFGVRARRATENSVAPQNFNGTFIFSGGLAPVLDANQQIVLDASGQPLLEQIASIERYRRTVVFQQQGLTPVQIAALGGGASQFSINTGIPGLAVNRFDIAVFAGDDWRLRPNLTVNVGLRYETQTNIHDPFDFAPRLGLAWAPGGRANNPRPKLVVRAGFGIFYDRFPLANTLTAARYNGVVQQQYVVTNPDFFPNLPSPAVLAAFQSGQVIQQVSPALRSPYILQSALTLERQLPSNTTVAVTYTNSRGFRELRSTDANAPLPGTYNPAVPGSGVFPLGHPGPLFLMESPGIFRQNQLSVNVNSKISPTISLFGTYVYGRALTDTEGLGTFPANPYDFTGEYGPASYDIRHRLNVGGSINTKWNVRLSPLIALQSGAPFDITTGSDLYGTSLFNARPGIATDPSRPGLIQTSYGLLDPNPSPGEKLVPRNFGRGPGQMSVNLRIAKIFSFGAERKPAKGGGIFAPPAERRYNVTVGLGIRNLLNHRNQGAIIGNITSPLFGQSNQMFGNLNGEGFSENANNRRLEAQVRLSF